MVSEKLQIAIIDDHPLFREGVAQTLGRQPDIEVVAEGESAEDAVAIAGMRLPDIMLLDVSMPGGGVNAARQIAAAYPVVKIVMLTVSQDEEDITAALRAGARAYVLKGVAARDDLRIGRPGGSWLGNRRLRGRTSSGVSGRRATERGSTEGGGE